MKQNMKKIVSTLCMALVAVAMMAQQPVITFDKTEHDFGKIAEDGGRVSTVFTFKNEGMAPLVLSNVRASCGCTTPTWTKEPIEPGQTGSITVTYNPNGRPGRFQKTVTITSNASEATKKVYIKGEVLPKQVKPTSKMTVAVGSLNMKSKTLDLGKVRKGDMAQGELEYTTLTPEEHHVALLVNAPDLVNQVTLEQVKTEEIGKFIFAIDTKKVKVVGPYSANVFVVVDGKKVLTDEFKLTINADIEEDFSQLTQEELMQAPILETAAEVELGTVAAGKVLKGQLSVKNIGVNPLLVQRVYSEEENIAFKPCKSVKSGKKGVINVEINTQDKKPGRYTREILLITNDPKQARKKIILNWVVE